MKSNEMVNQIKTLLNIEVKLEKMKLENGTVLEAESFEKGKEIFIITDDESVALPTGEYILEDSRLLVIDEEGMIADVREVSDEVPEKEEETTEDMIEEEAAEDEMAEDKDMAEVGDWEGMEKRIQNLEDAIADLKADKVEAAKVEEEVKEELSAEPAAKAIKHNPEGKESKEMKFTYSPNRIETTLDKILNKINNIKK
jgi:hypothetical protein